MKRLATLIVALVALIVQSNAQDWREVNKLVRNAVDSANISSVTGVLKDTKGDPIVNAYVECIADGKVVGRELTDFDGIYVIKPISESCVDVTFKFQGQEFVAPGVTLSPGNAQIANGTLPAMQPWTTMRCFRKIPTAEIPLVDPQHPGSSTTHFGNMLW